MGLKGHKGEGRGALVRESFVLMVSQDGEEVCLLADLLRARDACTLLAYENVEKLVQNVPRGRPTVAILADLADPREAERALSWLKRRWPRCTSVVVAAAAEKAVEMAVRRAGAMYMIRPVTQAEWLAILESGLKRSETAGKTRQRT